MVQLQPHLGITQSLVLSLTHGSVPSPSKPWRWQEYKFRKHQPVEVLSQPGGMFMIPLVGLCTIDWRCHLGPRLNTRRHVAMPKIQFRWKKPARPIPLDQMDALDKKVMR